MLILNFLIVDKQTTAKRSGIEKIVSINQPIYFRNALTLNGSQKIYLSHGNQKCFGGDVLLLFPQETRSCRFLLG